MSTGRPMWFIHEKHTFNYTLVFDFSDFWPGRVQP